MNCHQGSTIDLVGFSDASGSGYAAVIYSRMKTASGIATRLIASKGRVTPLKTKANMDSKLCTIPKFELDAVLLLTELYTEVMKSFSGLTINFTAYTDSEVALAWIRTEKPMDNRFVKRRVDKIRKVLNPSAIHYVKSAENPADPGSRGLYPNKLMECSLWFEGPHWMKEEELPSTSYAVAEYTNT